MEKKKMLMFYQPMCPFCKRAFQFIEELKAENKEFAEIEIEKIDELKEPDLADKYDYYYVPTFYVGETKIHEGHAEQKDVEYVLKLAYAG